MPKRLIGRGTQDWIAMLRPGEESLAPAATPLAPMTITLGAAGTKGGTSLTVTFSPALSTGVIPKGSYLLFTTATGKEILVQVDADVVGAATPPTTITTKALPADIANSSTSPYPLRLKFRKSADLDRNVNLIKTSDFDSDGLARQIASEIEQALKLDGDYCALDPAYNTLEYAIAKFQFIYVWHILPNPDATIYSLGKMYSGVAAIGSAPLPNPADGLITASVELKFDGAVIVTNPTPIT